jgi:hypothetical protein
MMASIGLRDPREWLPRWLGAMSLAERNRPAWSSGRQIRGPCDALVIPNYVAVNHAFAHGLPVITCHSEVHSPEIEYIEPEINGLVLRSLWELGAGPPRFPGSIELRRNLAAGALKSRE